MALKQVITSLLLLMNNLNLLLCCDVTTFDNIPVRFSNSYIQLVQRGEIGIIEDINVTGCVDDKLTLSKFNIKDALEVSIRNAKSTLRSLKPGSIENLSELQRITVVDNDHLDLEPGCFRNLPHLKYVFIERNKINRIKTNTFMNLFMETLSLLDNEIETIDMHAFVNLPYLNFLNLYNNNIMVMGQWFNNVPKLKDLYLSTNKLSGLSLSGEAFNSLPSLEWLDISRNRLETIYSTTFDGLVNLKRLSLSDNSLITLPAKVFSKLRNCTVLDLSGNSLTFIYDQHLEDLKGLDYFNIYSNPMQCSCWFKIERWAGKNHIKLEDVLCGKPDVAACVNPMSYKSTCIEAIQEDFLQDYQVIKNMKKTCRNI